jgi:protein-disulfide isomerase
MSKQKVILFSVIGLILLFVLGSYFYKGSQSKKMDEISKSNNEVFIRPHSTIVGPEDAKVTLVEFFDPACEACRAFYPLVKKIMEENPGQIRHVFRYAPFHPDSDYIVKILEAAKMQGKYFEALEALFHHQNKWASHHKPNIKMVWRILPSAGIDTEKLQEDMKDPKLEAIVQQDIADAKTLDVRKTPGYFVNGKPLQKFGYEELKALIKSEIDK